MPASSVAATKRNPPGPGAGAAGEQRAPGAAAATSLVGFGESLSSVFEQGQRMACSGQAQGKTWENYGYAKKGKETARSNSDLLSPPLKAVMFSPSEGLRMHFRVL